jgi:exodeoxyribonuclease-5
MILYNKYIRDRIVSSIEDVLLCKDDLLLAYSSVLDEFNSLVITNSDNYVVYNNELTRFVKDSIPGYLVKLQNVEDGELSKFLFIVDSYDENALSAYMYAFNALLRKAKTATNPTNRKDAWKNFYAFKSTFLLLENIIYDNKVISSADFNYGHAITVHKSQGSTYEHACINLRDIVYTSTNIPRANIDIRNRLLYVALSRVRKSAILYI